MTVDRKDLEIRAMKSEKVIEVEKRDSEIKELRETIEQIGTKEDLSPFHPSEPCKDNERLSELEFKLEVSLEENKKQRKKILGLEKEKRSSEVQDSLDVQHASTEFNEHHTGEQTMFAGKIKHLQEELDRTKRDLRESRLESEANRFSQLEDFNTDKLKLEKDQKQKLKSQERIIDELTSQGREYRKEIEDLQGENHRCLEEITQLQMIKSDLTDQIEAYKTNFFN